MDGRDSAKCRKSKLRDIDGIIEFVLNGNNVKIVNNIISYKLKRSQNVKKETGEMQKVRNGDFRERVRHFSLNLRAIRPSEFVGARRKAVLRGEGNVSVPVYWSFDKLREVGDLSYLGFILYLSVL